MIVIPAIDLMEGCLVRLTRGDPKAKKVYPLTPLDAAQKFKEQGAELIHVVDLDGALGQGDNFSVVEGIARKSGVDIEMGGGIRSLEYAQKILDCGVKRIVVSTKALEDRKFLDTLLERFGERVAFSLDVKNGRPVIAGWKQSITVNVENVVKSLELSGLKWLIYTDVSRDGTLRGPNNAGVAEIQRMTSVQIIASGGVSALKDIKEINTLGVWGVIVGKALYEQKFTLKEAIDSLS
ncbi:1-(5-phosphoribosyl)-5-[(5-phosphoribosylamino)methylideneamino]imidazole-4-carboxamide isomerase [Candidatus Omnitrophota bacterium]